MTEPTRQTLRQRMWSDARSAATDNDFARALGYHWGRWLAFALMLVALVVWSQGGFERAQPVKQVSPAKAPLHEGQPIDGGLYKVVPVSAWATRKLMASANESSATYPGNTSNYLMVEMLVTLQADRAGQIQSIEMSLPWLQERANGQEPKLAYPDVMREGDAIPLVLQPGVPIRVVARWTIYDNAFQPPKQLWLGLKGYRFVPEGGVEKTPRWVTSAPAGTWRLTVQDRRNEAEPAEGGG